MTNAKKFKCVFGLYATELWAMDEDKMLKWLNAEYKEPERKRGRWIVVDNKYDRISGRCSVCRWEAHMYEDDVVGMDYCPNCSAEMEGEQDD